jgi:hypothetical protein
MASERKRFLKGFVRTFSTLDSLAKKAEMKLGFHNGWIQTCCDGYGSGNRIFE